MKKIVGKIVRSIISPYVYRIIRNKPLLVPSYYKNILKDIESFIEIQQVTYLSNDEEKAMLSLRKQAHIIDKGLQRKDFKPGRSKAHYHCAINEIKKITSDKLLKDNSHKWACKKIKEFEVRQEGINVQESNDSEAIRNLPSVESLKNLIMTRRSVRYFTEKIVSKDILNECIEVINWAPSSCNKQPIQVFATNNPKEAIKCASNCKGFTGFGSYIPCFMAVCVDTRGYIYPMEMYLPSVDASLGAENMLLMLHAQGLSSTVLTWAQKDQEEEENLRKLLNIPDYCTIIFNVVAGYPDFIPPTPERKCIESTFYLNE